MKRFAIGIALPIALCSLILIGCDESSPVASDAGVGSDATLSKLTGNGGPNGPHYNLNIIAGKEKNPNLDGGNGHRIFVLLGSDGDTKRTRINLCNSSDAGGDCADVDFAVLDANGTDGTAEFALPDPCAADNADPTQECTSTSYSVWARALGKPGGKADLTTCAEDDQNLEYCSTEILSFERKGKQPPKFGDVSRYLLTLNLSFVADTATSAYDVAQCLSPGTSIGGTVNKRVGLFNSCLEDYFWYYDNKGLKLLQLRFYPIPSDLPTYQ